MRWITAIAAIAAWCFSICADASRLTPPVLPLIVRNPYLSTWLPNARKEPWNNWPIFWDNKHQGFSILASLPNSKRVYPLLGRPQDSLDGSDTKHYNITYPTYNGATFDASTTNLSYTIKNPSQSSQSVDIILSFLSPITPSSTFRQAIPAAYLTVFISGNTNASVYVDVNGQWVSGNRNSAITWELQNNPLGDKKNALKTWRVHRTVEALFTEVGDQAEWGSLYFTAPSNISYQSGTSQFLRKGFARNGTLENKEDKRFRNIMDSEPVFAFAKSFGGHRAKADQKYTDSVTFTIAHIQNPVVQFAAARGLTNMRPLWASYINDDRNGVQKLLSWHYADYKHARKLADRYSTQLAKDAFKSGADDYVDIVALSARQVMGGTTFAGTPDDPLLFLKEISSDGNTQTIDVIFPAFPFFLYTNPRWLAYLLEPLLEHMLSGQYPNKYAMHDIGSNFPNATGHADGNDEYMPVEECGNILIMGLAMAHAIRQDGSHGVTTSSEWRPMLEHSRVQSVKDFGVPKLFPLTVGQDEEMDYIDDAWAGTPQSEDQAQQWVTRSYRLWDQWTGYLVKYALEPENQLSTDDFAGKLALQTNLALKGIIGIKAMSGLSALVGRTHDAKRFNTIATDYIAKWEKFAMSRDKTHAKVAYNWWGSWTTTYNLYADSILCFHISSNTDASAAGTIAGPHGIQRPLKPDHGKTGFVPNHIYQLQSDWYWNVRQKYGLPLDSRHLYTKTDWEFWAMSVAAPGVRAGMLELVAKWVNETATDRPLTDLHNTEDDGGYLGGTFVARPVVGGHFAFLSLEKACGGRAMEGLKFLNDDVTRGEAVDVDLILQREREANSPVSYEL